MINVAKFNFHLAGILIAFVLCRPMIAAASEPDIPPGTVITAQNWQQYQQFMADGMKGLFAGTWGWKLPSDYQLIVGPTKHYPLPTPYVQLTEKYSAQVKIINLPDGRHTLSGYVGGLPFPDPQEPMKGWKLLVDDWYSYVPYILCGNTAHITLEDRFNHVSRETFALVERIFSHRADLGVSVDDPAGAGMYYTEYIEVLSPEQARYTTVFTIYWADLTRNEDTYVFIPALRRSLRLSSAARCSPAISSDYSNDDTRHGGFNGNPTRFDADYLGDRKVLVMPDPDPRFFDYDEHFVQPLFFPKPEVGKWEVRNSHVINIYRVASERPGYCYGKRLLYCDAEVYMAIWDEIYDENKKFWKLHYDSDGQLDLPGDGKGWSNDGWGIIFDVQNRHLSRVSLSADRGHILTNSNCANLGGVDYTDTTRFSTVRGLSEIMK